MDGDVPFRHARQTGLPDAYSGRLPGGVGYLSGLAGWSLDPSMDAEVAESSDWLEIGQFWNLLLDENPHLQVSLTANQPAKQ